MISVRGLRPAIWSGLLILMLALLYPRSTRVQTAGAWETTGTFEVPAVAADGTAFSYTMRGHEGQFGFIDSPFVAGKTDKYMWHFWGNQEDFLYKTLEVTGVNRRGQRVPVLTSTLGGEHNGAVAHTPSMMSLPTPGLWRLEVRVDGNHLGDIVVEVLPAA
ncbi:hypothetical protein [Symbiobacterium thermophilum]|uniref:hypothetical protein n=1 Tax=Symbiobacterium thermophilum TaxID=2734 RepID=UPI0035C7141C